METTKKCTQCKQIKNLSEYSKNKSKKDGLRIYCKTCAYIRHRDFTRTKRGLVGRIYSSQKSSSLKRGHASPTYSHEEIREWLYSQPLFHKLYDNWKRLDYQKMYKPSVDRIDDYIGYTIANIQLMTWGENSAKGHKDRIDGINNKLNKGVVQYTKEGEHIAEYHSTIEAKRQTGVWHSSISAVCAGKRVSAGGFFWRYIDAS